MLTVGELLERIENVPDDAVVYVPCDDYGDCGPASFACEGIGDEGEMILCIFI